TAGHIGGNPGHRARSRRRHGQRRGGLFVGQGRSEPCAGGDGRRTRDRCRHDPRQSRLDHDGGRYRPFSRSLDKDPPAALAESRMSAPAKMERPNRLPIYLDNQSTTPIDPRVLEAMLPYFTEHFGNPHSESHVYGKNAAAAIEAARADLARLVNADPRE